MGKMEVLQARDWRGGIDERQEVEQTIQRSYQCPQYLFTCLELCYSPKFGQEPPEPRHVQPIQVTVYKSYLYNTMAHWKIKLFCYQ